MARGQDGKISHRCFCGIISVKCISDPLSRRTDKRIIANVTSNEIVLLPKELH